MYRDLCQMIVLVLLAAVTALAQDVAPSVTYTFDDDTVPAAFGIAAGKNRWTVQDGQLVNADDQVNDTLRLPVAASRQTHVQITVETKKVNDKGGFWGVAFLLADGTRVQVFSQNAQFRYYIQKTGEKLQPKTFAPMPGDASNHATFTLDANDGTLTASTDEQKHELALPSGDIVGVQFQAYQAHVGINQLTLRPTLAAGAASHDADNLKSQLAVGDPVNPPSDPNAMVILFIGDSITRHGFNERTVRELGWDHVAGMAASEESKDYAHVFAAAVQKMHPDRNVLPYFHERGGTGNVQSRLAALGAFESLKADIVVVQLGEHEKQHVGAEQLETNYRKLLSTMQAWPSKPTVLCVGVWDPYGKGEQSTYVGWTQQVDQTMAKVCKELAVPYASMAQHALNPANSGTGTSHGVRWHPNDAGMAAYAAELLAMYRKATSAK